MKETKASIHIAFLSTYPPRECGIATFTEDLISSIDDLGTVNTSVIAMNNSENYSYDIKVMGEIRQEEREDYIEMAKRLNSSNINLLVVEHEYGIYGGDHGDYILDLINNVEIPVVTTLHTILSDPSPRQKEVIYQLGQKSEKIITMAQNTKEMLEIIYGVASKKIEVIHHGVAKRPHMLRETLKKMFGYENKKIISTFGLIGPGKGIEHGIQAIAEVINGRKQSVEVLYLILGQTHPALKEQGTNYRKKLEELVEHLDLTRNIVFVNKYLSKDEIIQYLQLSDIYMTPYLAKDQAVSGTLANAVGYGKAIVSTPYLYAQEMLAEDRGLLAEFSKPESLADCINQILEDPARQIAMERKTEKFGKSMFWDKVAVRYIDVLLKVAGSTEELGEVK